MLMFTLVNDLSFARLLPPSAPLLWIGLSHLPPSSFSSDSRNNRSEDGRISAVWMKNKAHRPWVEDTAIHYLVISCLGIESSERSYTVIMLPDSINFVFQWAWCKQPAVLAVTALKAVPKILKTTCWNVTFSPWCQPAEDEKNISSKGYFESVWT